MVWWSDLGAPPLAEAVAGKRLSGSGISGTTSAFRSDKTKHQGRLLSLFKAEGPVAIDGQHRFRRLFGETDGEYLNLTIMFPVWFLFRVHIGDFIPCEI